MESHIDQPNGDTMTTAVAEVETSRELVPSNQQFMPVMSVDNAFQRYDSLVRYIKGHMVQGKDYGVIPGSDKPTLLKPGAEKLCTFFGLCVRDPEFVDAVKDWTGRAHGEPFFYFEVRQRLERNGHVIASQVGSANSMESKYRYRWIAEHDVPEGLDKAKLKRRDGVISEFDFAIQKAETGGKYGKPAEYWQAFRDAIANRTARRFKKKTGAGKELDAWEIGGTVYRVPNPDIADTVNTLQKMAQKRALIAATLIAVNASEFFTQDLEDHVADAEVVSSRPAEEHTHDQPKNGNGHVPHRLSDAQLDTLKTWMLDAGVSEEKVVKSYGVPFLSALPAEKVAEVIQRCQSTIREREKAKAVPEAETVPPRQPGEGDDEIPY